MVNRRRFITLTGLAATTAVAGCSGDGGNEEGPPSSIETSEGPAEFAVYDASWTTDESVQVDDEAQVELIIGNRGGEPGELSGELLLQSLESSDAPDVTGAVSSVDGEVASGETVSVTSESVTVRYAGRYDATLSTGEMGGDLPVAEVADVELSVEPHTGAQDETLPLTGDLRMSVRDAQFEEALHREALIGTFGTERVGLESTLDDQTFLVVHATVENTGNEGRDVSSNLFTFAGENALPRSAFVGLDGDSLDGASVNPGSQAEGYLVFRVPRDAVPDGTLNVHRDSRSAPADTVWNLDLGEVEFPQFEFESMDVPEQYEDGWQEFTFTVRNTGDAGGTFRGAIEYREDDEGDWDGLLAGNGDMKAEIPPGETATVTSGTEFDGEPGLTQSDTYGYRFIPFNATFVIGDDE